MEDRRTREALEALADLYLTEPVEVDSDSPDPRQKRSSRQNGPGGPIRVEAVLIGHLPGASGSWASQYAEHVAEQRGPAVMLHFEQGGLIVDVYRIDQAADNNYKFPTGAAAESAEPEPSPADDDLPPGASLTELLEHLAAGGDLATWLVRPPQPTGEIGRRIVQAIDRWTLISGCDDAAVVAGYRLLKGLRTHDESDRRVGLMIMGAEGPPAELAAAKLRRTLDEFLETPAEAVGYRPRMTPLHRRTLAEFEGDVAALWQEAAAWMAGRGVEPPAEPAEEEPTTDQQPPAPETGPTAGESPRPTPAFGPEPHWRESADRLDREISEDFQPTMTAAEARSHAHEAGDSEAPAAPPQAESEPEPEMAAGAASEAPPEPAPALP